MTLDRWLALIGILFGAAGCGLAVWFFRRSEKRRIPTFLVHPERKLLADPALTQLEGLSLLHADRKVGEKGITEVQIYFWNSGNLPLLQSEILEPFVIRIAEQILAFAITKVSRPVVHLQARAEPPEGGIALSFAVLEPGDGGTLQVVFAGPPATRIDFAGACVGAAKPAVLPSDPMFLNAPAERFIKSAKSIIWTLSLTAVVVAVFWGFSWGAARLLSERAASIATVVFDFGLAAVGLAFLFWAHYERPAGKYVPPDVRSE